MAARGRCRTKQLAHSSFVNALATKQETARGKTQAPRTHQPLSNSARARPLRRVRSRRAHASRSMAENPNPPTTRPAGPRRKRKPPKKYARGPDDEIYRRKREPKKPKPPDLSKDLQQMMYGFGDAQEVDAESVDMVEGWSDSTSTSCWARRRLLRRYGGVPWTRGVCCTRAPRSAQI